VTSRASPRSLGLLLAGFVVLGCSVDTVDLTGKRCPCAPGWRCDEATYRCVEDHGPDAASPRDAGRDGGSTAPDAAGSLDASGDAPIDPVDAATDAPGDGGAPRSPCDELRDEPTTLLCEDFEAPTLGWTRIERTGTVSLTTERAHGGRQSLLARTTEIQNGGRAMAESPSWPPLLSREVWIRAHYFIPEFVDENVSVLAVWEAADPGEGFSVHVVDGGDPVVWLDSTSRGYRGSVPVPRERWFCMQIHARIDDADGRIELDFDGARIVTVTGGDTLPPTGYPAINVGITWTGTTQVPATVYVDDIVVATAPIACADPG